MHKHISAGLVRPLASTPDFLCDSIYYNTKMIFCQEFFPFITQTLYSLIKDSF